MGTAEGRYYASPAGLRGCGGRSCRSDASPWQDLCPTSTAVTNGVHAILHSHGFCTVPGGQMASIIAHVYRLCMAAGPCPARCLGGGSCRGVSHPGPLPRCLRLRSFSHAGTVGATAWWHLRQRAWAAVLRGRFARHRGCIIPRAVLSGAIRPLPSNVPSVLPTPHGSCISSCDLWWRYTIHVY